ncbi:hypothetical protein FRC09_020923 [Ceratobasidium sp. 395]|nr:hypothetical protein FRC09_020923 [Ceratobasidium sp. 395]
MLCCSATRTTRLAAKRKTGKASASQVPLAAQPSLSSKSELAKADDDKQQQPSRKRVARSNFKPGPKSAAAPSKLTRGKQGKLQGLMNMPIDIFTEICGEQALRPMDPILQVRLCVKCRDEQAVNVQNVADVSLVFQSSRGFVPRKHWEIWCLDCDIKAVEDKLFMLGLDDNQEEKECWIDARRAIVSDRIENAQPLIEFLKAMDSEHDAELLSVKEQREAEIKSRLLNLGYEEQDITISNRRWSKDRRQEWKSMACIAKPLTERAWETIRPSLLSWVERNRDERLGNEKGQRKWERQQKIATWLRSLGFSLDPFARALDPALANHVNLGEVSTPGPSNANASLIPVPIMKSDTMLDQEMSPEELDQALQESRPAVDKPLSEWIQDIEQTLLNLLSGNPAPSKDNNEVAQIVNPLPDYTYVLSDGSDMRPLTDLPPDIQRLLRADCVFMEGSSAVAFYPHDFYGMGLEDKNNLTYNPSTVKIARALLSLLGLSDAIYLRLKAPGHSFVCGRCHKGIRMTWKQIIRHYVDETAAYAAIQENSRVHTARSFTYVFTHDIDVVIPDKPLLRVDSTEPLPASGETPNPDRHCLVCKSVGITCQQKENLMLHHVREVHLVESPKLNKHYR